jgi:hypothetical protein
MVVVPAATGTGAAVVAAGESLTGTIAGTVVQYTRAVTTFLLPVGSTGMATAAEPTEQQPPSQETNLNLIQDFVYWPD